MPRLRAEIVDRKRVLEDVRNRSNLRRKFGEWPGLEFEVSPFALAPVDPIPSSLQVHRTIMSFVRLWMLTSWPPSKTANVLLSSAALA